MPLSDWMLEANEESNMDSNILNPTNDRLRAYIIHNLFTDFGEEEPFYQEAYETNAVLKLRKNAENRN